MTSTAPSERQNLIRRFASRLRFPQLFVLLSGLFLLDFFVVDPIPFVDEAILGVMAVLVGMWKDHRATKEQPIEIKDVTPRDEGEETQSP